ncbi:hypothetical protein MRX96_004665 [Rhipicephalus microplus]
MRKRRNQQSCPDGCQSALNADCPVEAVFMDEEGVTSGVVGKADATSDWGGESMRHVQMKQQECDCA